MPRGPLDIIKKVLGMYAQVVTKPSLATSGQLTIITYIIKAHIYTFKFFFISITYCSYITSVI